MVYIASMVMEKCNLTPFLYKSLIDFCCHGNQSKVDHHNFSYFESLLLKHYLYQIKVVLLRFPTISLWELSVAMAMKPKGKSPYCFVILNPSTQATRNRFNGFGGVVKMETHYKNTSIQIYRKFHLQKRKIFR